MHIIFYLVAGSLTTTALLVLCPLGADREAAIDLVDEPTAVSSFGASNLGDAQLGLVLPLQLVDVHILKRRGFLHLFDRRVGEAGVRVYATIPCAPGSAAEW